MLKFCRLKLLFRFAHQRGNTFQSLVMYPAGVRAKRENKEREEGWWQRGNGWFLLQSYESTDHEKCVFTLAAHDSAQLRQGVHRAFLALTSRGIPYFVVVVFFLFHLN